LFADDSRQSNPTRKDMGPIVVIGGVCLPTENIKEVESEINEICKNTGFPPKEEFKWSPGRELWMRDNLLADERQNFFESVLGLVEQKGGIVTVVVEDINCDTATDTDSHEIDVTRLYLERVDWLLNRLRSNGIVIVDRPSGNRAKEDKFLLNCLETLQNGTDYVKPDKIPLNVLSSPSCFIRLLQVADLIVGCTTAFISGEQQYSPAIFNKIKPMFDKTLGRIGGVGLKIHPDLRYVNLYHWIVEDDTYIRHMSGWPLPKVGHLYYENNGI